MDIQKLFVLANSALNDIVLQVHESQFDVVMPAYAAYFEGQTLQRHIAICAHENACVPGMFAGEHVQGNQEFTEDYLKDDFKANFAALTDKANQVVSQASPEDLKKIVHMSYADAPASDYLHDIIIQRSMAAIDIAQAAGIAITWPDTLVKGVWDVAAPSASMLREYGVFPAEVTVSQDAPLLDKLIALMGRQPS